MSGIYTPQQSSLVQLILNSMGFTTFPQRTLNSQGGTIWSMAANSMSTLIALGCDDGAIRLLSLEDGSLEHFRRFDRTKARLLSIAWGPAVRSNVASGDSSSDDGDVDSEWTDSWIVAGCSDSSLRKFDFLSGHVTERLVTDKSRSQRTLVWAVGSLKSVPLHTPRFLDYTQY